LTGPPPLTRTDVSPVGTAVRRSAAFPPGAAQAWSPGHASAGAAGVAITIPAAATATPINHTGAFRTFPFICCPPVVTCFFHARSRMVT
jgi:hypothetical protein